MFRVLLSWINYWTNYMKAPICDFEQLNSAKMYVGLISLQGFLINVENSYKEGVITEEQKQELIEKALKNISS